MIFQALTALLRALGSEHLIYPLRQLYGGSFGVFWRRALRLRRTARGMASADPAPPLPVRLQIETTDICNMKCRMCTREVIDGMNTVTMSLKQFEDTVSAIAPYYVTMNGLGEPLIDPTVFDKLKFLHDRGIVTAMPTNGTYVRGDRLAKLAENLPDTLTFSIDGGTRESYEYVRVLGDFEQITTNYRALLARRREPGARPNTRVQVLFVMQKANLFEYRQAYQLKQSLPGVDSFSVVPVFDYDVEGHAFAYLVPRPEDVKKLHAELDAAIAGTANPEEREFYSNWREVSSIWLDAAPAAEAEPHACLVPWYSTYIDAKGSVYPCCYLTNSSHVMGNINQSSFAEIWSGAAYREFRSTLARDRAHLSGCRTCSRNDDGPLHQLQRFRAVL